MEWLLVLVWWLGGTGLVPGGDLPGPKTEASSAPAAPSRIGTGFDFERRSDRLKIRLNGRPAAEFVFRDARILRPYFAQVCAPNGVQVTRRHPPVAGSDATDHDTMHPGLWLAFGDLSGADFWRNKARMDHLGFVDEPRVDGGRLSFATESRLSDERGTVRCHLIQRFGLIPLGEAWRMDWVAELRSEDGDFAFGDQEEMGLGARVATPMAEKNGGRLRSSEGRESAASTWGRAAAWCDYSGRVEGEPAGITLMADPANFRPSWWHNRDYGLFVANPFGRAAMRQGEVSSVVVRRGESFVLRFGVLIHGGDAPDPAAAYRDFLRR